MKGLERASALGRGSRWQRFHVVGNRWRLIRRRLAGSESHKLAPALFLLFFDVPENRIQIIIEARSMRLANPADFIDDWVGHGDSQISSCAQSGGRVKRCLRERVSASPPTTI